MNIFISYRRSDTPDVSGRIYDELVRHFGDDAVFKDVDDIPLGVNFQRYLHDTIQECCVMLVVIGASWLNVTDEHGQRRLDQPEDFVRIEVQSALQRKLPIVPLLVKGATMPKASELPAALSTLAYYSGIRIRPDPDFHTDMARLIRQIEPRVTPPGKAPTVRQAPRNQEGRPQAPPVRATGPKERTQTAGQPLVKGIDRWWGLLWVLAYVLAAILNGINSQVVLALAVGSVTAAVLGLVQWALMRRRIPVSAWWILLTFVGWMAGWLIKSLWPIPLSRLTVISIVVGALQWLYVRQHVRGAGWWWIACVAGWLVTDTLNILGLRLGSWLVYKGLVGALSGALTAGALALLSRRPRAEP